jgi:hypothetical protein
MITSDNGLQLFGATSPLTVTAATGATRLMGCHLFGIDSLAFGLARIRIVGTRVAFGVQKVGVDTQCIPRVVPPTWRSTLSQVMQCALSLVFFQPVGTVLQATQTLQGPIIVAGLQDCRLASG